MPTLLVLAIVAGCEGKPSLVGAWSFPLPNEPMTIQFRPDGTYEASPRGSRASRSGTYRVTADRLTLDPGPSGKDRETEMTLTMTALGPGAYRLSAPPQLSFVMSRMGNR